jgi:hypothetical protein
LTVSFEFTGRNAGSASLSSRLEREPVLRAGR